MNYELRIKNKVFENRQSSIVNRNSQRGFTIIELLVVLVVLLVIGSILIGILFSSLRGTNKVNSIDNVRRNGNYALEQMGKMIRYSQSFNGVSTNGIDFSTKKCITVIPPAPTPTPTPSSYNYIEITGFDGGQTILSCIPNFSLLGAPEIASTSASGNNKVHFIDPDQTTTSIDIVSCSITCTQSTVVSPPTVTIQFELRNRTASGLSENQASVPFQTSVTVRNY